MKSMLHEASSIIKAVEKAWTESGKPSEFTIKVLEKGEKNFIGMTTRPAIISITYGYTGWNDRNNQNNQRDSRSRFVPQNAQKEAPKNINIVRPSSPQPQYQAQHQVQNQAQTKITQVDKTPKKEILPLDADINVWTSEFISFCMDNLKELFKMLSLDCTFSTKVNNKLLTVMLNKHVAIHGGDVRIFYASISHLLLQFLKKKYKKKFNGFQIIINSTTSNSTAPNETTTSRPN